MTSPPNSLLYELVGREDPGEGPLPGALNLLGDRVVERLLHDQVGRARPGATWRIPAEFVIGTEVRLVAESSSPM